MCFSTFPLAHPQGLKPSAVCVSEAKDPDLLRALCPAPGNSVRMKSTSVCSSYPVPIFFFIKLHSCFGAPPPPHTLAMSSSVNIWSWYSF